MQPRSNSPVDKVSLRFSDFTNGGYLVETSNDAFQLPRQVYCQENKITQALGEPLSPLLSDLKDIAIAAYVADRLVPRRRPERNRYYSGWTRSFVIKLPVREPSIWRSAELYKKLTDCLEYFSEDIWHFEFEQREKGFRESEDQGHLVSFKGNGPTSVALFSGGLDSLAGSSTIISNGIVQQIVLISSVTNPRTKKVQDNLVRDLRNKRRNPEVVHVGVELGIRQNGKGYDSNEITQRTRGFLFQALGSVAAALFELNELFLFENGVGAINLPYLAVQLGAHNTRTANPVGLAKMSDLVSAILGRRFSIHNPFVYYTKGEICRIIHEAGMSDLISKTISCDGFPQRIAGHPQCGICTSCLLRRQALHAYGLGFYDKGSQYRWDIVEDANNCPDEKLDSLRMMLDQVHKMKVCFTSPNPWSELVGHYPILDEIVGVLEDTNTAEASVREKLLAMYRSYCREWIQFPTQPKGYQLSPGL